MKFFAALAILTAALATLAQDLGAVRVVWRGFEIRTNALVAAAISWALVEAIILSLKLGRKAFKRRRKRGEEAQENA
ncbi:MAG: hypothetical protein LBT92_04295 [Rickettsiales bacterium]|jgi:uncharacterized membrane-anchored protein|nr:hypothetical protein [Rickettsiales bacterium]